MYQTCVLFVISTIVLPSVINAEGNQSLFLLPLAQPRQKWHIDLNSLLLVERLWAPLSSDPTGDFLRSVFGQSWHKRRRCTKQKSGCPAERVDKHGDPQRKRHC